MIMHTAITGSPEPPALQAKTVGMMGLKGVPGLTIQKRPSASQQPAAGVLPFVCHALSLHLHPVVRML